jgi:hypothetical protein
MEKLADLNMTNRPPTRSSNSSSTVTSIEERIKLAADRVGQNVGI